MYLPLITIFIQFEALMSLGSFIQAYIPVYFAPRCLSSYKKKRKKWSPRQTWFRAWFIFSIARNTPDLKTGWFALHFSFYFFVRLNSGSIEINRGQFPWTEKGLFFNCQRLQLFTVVECCQFQQSTSPHFGFRFKHMFCWAEWLRAQCISQREMAECDLAPPGPVSPWASWN